MREMQRWLGIGSAIGIVIFAYVASTRIDAQVFNTIFAVVMSALVLGALTLSTFAIVMKAKRSFEISPPHFNIERPPQVEPPTYQPPALPTTFERTWTFHDGSTQHQLTDSNGGFDF